jgi:16S rRNA A1518/A1519 N6-dimethyltransferase RsmA/KsgA/DIM1 with predicted DNA glycosylase/AP lyase activity
MNATDWSRFRVESISLPTFLKRNLIHADLLRAVAARADGGVLEVGIGSGAQSALLSRFFPTTSLDNDFRIINLARTNLSRFGPTTRVVMGDAFALPSAMKGSSPSFVSRCAFAVRRCSASRRITTRARMWATSA